MRPFGDSPLEIKILSARLSALLLAAQSVFQLALAAFPEVNNKILPGFLPLTGELPARSATLALGVALLALAGGMWRRKQYSWAAALGLYLGVAGVHWLRGPVWLPSLLAFGLATWLFWQREAFTARSHPGAVRAATRVWALGAALALVLGAAFLGPTPGKAGLAGVISGAARGASLFVLFDDPVVNPDGALIPRALFYLGSALAWFALWRGWERPLPPPALAGHADRCRAQTIIQAFGRTSMAHLTLLPDKCYFFTGQSSLVAYAVYGRVALALGDPIGPAAQAADAIRAFREYCIQNDWLPAFCLTSAELLGVYRRFGFGALCLGHEGVIDLADFSLRGNARKTLRKRYNRLTALGYRVVISEPPISIETLVELRKISDDWLGMARAAEKRFFLAWFDEELVRNERLALVYAPDGAMCAFTSLVPEYQLNEISIDLMRRRRGIESGVMDFLFVSLLIWARSQGYATFNLGLSPLFGVGSPDEDRSGVRRLSLETWIRFAYEHGDFYDFKGLNGFKLKFHPRWVPQYMIYPGLWALPMVGLTMARANAGEHETLWQYFRRRPQQDHPDELVEMSFEEVRPE